MKENDLKTVVLYFLNNNRPGFIQLIEEKIPTIFLTNFYPVIDNLNNEDLSQYITAFLRTGNNLKLLLSEKIEYNINASNYTTSDEIFEYIKDINNDKEDYNINDILSGTEPKVEDGTWWQSLGDFFGGSTEPETITKTETTEKTNWLLILSLLAGLVGTIFMVAKFYRKSP